MDTSNTFRYPDDILFFSQGRVLDQDDDYYVDKETLDGLLVLFVFFVGFNSILATMVLAGLWDLVHLRCTNNTAILIFPHWVIGILLPAFIGYAQMGANGVALYIFVCVVIPYAFCGFVSYRSGCTRETETAPSTEAVEEGNAVDIESGIIDPNLLSEAERRAYLEEALKFTKVVEGSIRNTTDAEKSYRMNHPKLDIVVSKDGRAEQVDDASSEDSCAICLEEYKNVDTVCWSRNSNCHHVFHKDCAMDWLMKNIDCPVCRRPYIGVRREDEE